MLKTILSWISTNNKKGKVKNTGDDLRKGGWAEKQVREMAKLRGRLILM